MCGVWDQMGVVRCAKRSVPRTIYLWLEKETTGGLRNFRLSSPLPSSTAVQEKRVNSQGFIYHFTNNKMKPVRKEFAQPYCTRAGIGLAASFRWT
jgi:hypothetical protein